jgi:DNA-binding NtrC family response regulator
MDATPENRPLPTRQLSGFRYSVDRFRLRVVSGPDRDTFVDAEATELTIGTAEGNQLRLTDPSVSRHHCSLVSTPQGVRLRDLGSTNGTRIGGCRVDSACLAPGAHFVLGGTEILFERLDGEISEAVSVDACFGTLLGTSVAMRRLFAALPRLARSEVTILIEGETGTGKSMMARAIHDRSHRASGPFVVVDCGSIPQTLIESELFGHERGAFTGAHGSRIGFFESAVGGTVFLDEVGELPLDLQPKLLRVLENRVIRRIGARHDSNVDARIIAATHHDLRQEANAGRFRSDLLYRLNTIRLSIPPLRERPGDIPMLITQFWAELADDATGRPPSELVGRFARQSWPGNVRELRSAVERYLLMADADVSAAVRDADLTHEPLAQGTMQPFSEAKAIAIARWERAYLDDLIRQHNGNISRAARVARMNRNHLRELLIRHEVDTRSR